MTDAEALAACPIKRGMRVCRKGDLFRTAGTVHSTFIVYRCSHQAVRCMVRWEGAANGARRFGGGDWNITRCILASSLEILPAEMKG